MLISDRYKNDGNPGTNLYPIQWNSVWEFIKMMESGEFETVNCDCDCGCKFENLEVISEKDRFGIPIEVRICPECGLMMHNPRLTKDSYGKFCDTIYRPMHRGALHFTIDYYEGQLKHGNAIMDFIFEHSNKEKIDSVLEIGCASGGILKAIKDRGITSDCTGVDLGREYLHYGKSQGLNLIEGRSDVLLELNKKYDLIILSHVITEMVDLDNELDIVNKLLNENGLVYIEFPGVFEIEANYGDIMKSLRTASLRYLCLDTLRQAMQRHNFELVYGTEFVKAIFKKTTDPAKLTPVKNKYSDIKKYLKDVENSYNEKINVNDMRDGNVVILETMLSAINNGWKFDTFFQKRKISDIAVYGNGVIGRNFFNLLKGSDIKISHFIDKNPQKRDDGITVYSADNEYPDAGAFVMAVAGSYINISKTIRNKYPQTPIYSVQDILNEYLEADI